MKNLTTTVDFADQAMVNCLSESLLGGTPLNQSNFWDSLSFSLSQDQPALYELMREYMVTVCGSSVINYYKTFYFPEGDIDTMNDRLEKEGRKYLRASKKNVYFRELNLVQLGILAPIIRMINLEVTDFVRRIQELCELFGIHLTKDELELEHQKYAILSIGGDIIKQMKYSTNLAFTNHTFSHLDKEVQLLNAPLPFFGSLGLKLFPRRLRVTLNMMKSKYSWNKLENLQLIYTVFQGYKKGLFPMRPDGVSQNLKKHKAALSKDGSIPEDLLDDIERIFETHFPSIGKIMPSLNVEGRISDRATVESSCVQGGSLGFLYRRFNNLMRDDISISPPTLVGFKVEERNRFGTIQVCVPQPIYGFEVPSRDELLIEAQEYCGTLNSFQAQPSCIIEPMKIRIITKPNAGLYQGLRRFQKLLHGFLRGLTPFELIGSPMDSERAQQYGRWWKPGYWFTSGDYSGATDNLKSTISDFLIKRVLDRSNLMFSEPKTYQRILDSFTKSEIIYKKNTFPSYDGILDSYNHVMPDSFKQKNGQLMGHVLSFPILCLANYIAYVISVERYLGRETSFQEIIEKFPVRINGDDILFCSDLKLRKIWMEVIEEFGFEPSQGKNFVSQDFFQINSMMFEIRTKRIGDKLFQYELPDWKVDTVREVNYINFGLALGRSKNDCSKDHSVTKRIRLNEKSSDFPEQLLRVIAWPKIYQDYMSGLVSPLRERALKLWCKHQENLINFEGGLKLPVRIPGRDFEPTGSEPWEGSCIMQDTSAFHSEIMNSPIDALSLSYKRPFDSDDLKYSIKKIRRFNRNQLATSKLFSELPTVEVTGLPDYSAFLPKGRDPRCQWLA